MRYVDSAVDKVLDKMSQEEKRSYWNNIEDAFMTKQETSWTRSTMLRKLARHVTHMQPVAKKQPTKLQSKRWKEKWKENMVILQQMREEK